MTHPQEPAQEFTPISRRQVSSERVRMVRTITSRLFFVLLVVSIALALSILVPVWMEKQLAVVPVVLLAGAIGGFVSIQRRIKTLADDDLILIAGSVNYLLLAPFVGGILALTLYLAFLSGLISGDLFPVFKPPPGLAADAGLSALFQYEANGAGYAKLLFWSFVAGYSEKFVVDIIGNFEKGGTKS